MAVEASGGCLKFVVDECLSAHIARALNHCGKRLDQKISVWSLTKDELSRCETIWLPSRAANGFMLISSDKRMIVQHDIAALAKRCDAIVFLLRNDVSQLRRWALLRWFANTMPKLVSHAIKAPKGSTYLVSHDGSVVVVEPSRNLGDLTDKELAAL